MATSWWACCPRCHSPSTPTSAAFNTTALTTPTTSIAPSHRCVPDVGAAHALQCTAMCDEALTHVPVPTDCSAPCPTHTCHREPTSATVVAMATSHALLLLSTSDLEASVCQRPVVFRSRSVSRSALLPQICLSALLGSVWAPAQGCQRPRARLPVGERAAGNETPVV
jgi:hypothetical protein